MKELNILKLSTVKGGNHLVNNKEGKYEIDDDKRESKEGISFKHDKDGIKIYINIYNTNNLANEGGNAGVKQKASEGGQNLTGESGENAGQGGQIAEKGGQNANQFGQIAKNGGENEIIDAINEPGASGQASEDNSNI
jgi:hypothetical protein